MTINYKYNEGDLLREITDYIDSTYGEHYAQNQYQATEFIIDGGHGVGFTVGNILKYAQRYGHKGTPEDWRKDMMKVIHYAIIALFVHDKQHNKQLDLTDLWESVALTPETFTLSTSLSTDDTITIRGSDLLVGETVGYFGTMQESPLTTTATNSIITEPKKSKKKKD